MMWLLGASLVVNICLLYAWLHDVAVYKRSAEGYEKLYYDTLDRQYKKPVGTASRRLVASYPEGSLMRREEEARHRRMYGEEALG